MKTKQWCSFLVGVLLSFALPALEADGLKQVHGGYLPEVSKLSPTGLLPATNQLRLALSLPLRDREGLEKFVAQVSDPNSPNYRHYLTPDEFAARFGPTEQDYQAVKDFAHKNQLAVTATYGNRLVVDVIGPVAAVEKAFNVTLRTYRHPTEAREFFAPDTGPTVDAALPLADVSGLNNFRRPHSMHPKHKMERISSENGSSPDGNGAIFGDDFRNAYASGTKLTGAGQSIALFEWDGSYPNAVAEYAAATGGGRTNIVIQYVLLDGFNGVPTLGIYSGEPEVDMDIEMAMAMAPGLSRIVVIEGDPSSYNPIDILNTMAASNTIKNLSCSWAWSSDEVAYTNTDAIFLEMAAQGQSFFQASGDNEAYTVGATSTNGVDNPNNVFGYDMPFSSPYITQVGGTLLTMNGTGASYGSETVWNDAGSPYFEEYGSGGGVSSHYPIPGWQKNTSMTLNQGSTTQRNIPDVAEDSENIYEVTGADMFGDVTGEGVYADDEGGGTSSAAPLWAAFMSLVNEQAAVNGMPSVGFINPAIYAIGNGANYSACFNDTTAGNNEWSGSPSLYSAVTGYDLCTGWGTPKVGLINALSPSLGIDLVYPHMAGTAFQFQFLSQSGSTNAVEYRTNLISGTWQLYTNVTGDGTLMTISIPLSVFRQSPHGFVHVSTK
ncbi:MAG: S53 family serine peptidase [Verrucomicrobiota bacterium]|jgi:subtilase family serine protease